MRAVMANYPSLVCVVAACVLAHMAAGQPGAGGGCTHTIVAGDTFWQLSQAKGTTVEAIQAANPGLKAEALQIGSVIQLPPAACGAGANTPTGPVTPSNPVNPTVPTIPATPTTPTIPPTMPTIPPTTPTISPTTPTVPNTMPTIPTTTSTVPTVPTTPMPTTPTIPPTNPSTPTMPTTPTIPSNPTTPTQPTTPTFPTTPSTPGGSCTHTIVAGDTLWALSQARGMNVAALLQLNPGVVPEALQVGATLKVCPAA